MRFMMGLCCVGLCIYVFYIFF